MLAGTSLAGLVQGRGLRKESLELCSSLREAREPRPVRIKMITGTVNVSYVRTYVRGLKANSHLDNKRLRTNVRGITLICAKKLGNNELHFRAVS